jgi:glycine hydroxymethyltransferase
VKDKISEEILRGEERRQADEMELIASENYVSKDIREAVGSILANKYSEGYPGKRYYAGQEFTDKAENLAIDRAKKLFNCNYANVQPLSGAPANFAVYLSLLEPGDKLVGMDLAAGGHLTHGSRVSYTSKIWKSASYGVNPESGLIDYNEVRRIVRKEKPKLIIAGFSAYPRTIDWREMKSIADEVDAITVADVAHIAGFIASGEFENPLNCGFDIMTSTTHKTLRGSRGGVILTNNGEMATKINKAVFPGFQGGPHMNSILAKAITFWEAIQPEFKQYTKQVLLNAKTLSDALIDRGVEIITGGTDNHILTFNCVASFGIGGMAAQDCLEKAGLSTNRNSIPNETRSPFDPSGIRLGTPAMTTRGFKEMEFTKTADFIIRALKAIGNDDEIMRINKEVSDMCANYPIP